MIELHGQMAARVGLAPTLFRVTTEGNTLYDLAMKWSERQVTLLLKLGPKPSASLLGYVPLVAVASR